MPPSCQEAERSSASSWPSPGLWRTFLTAYVKSGGYFVNPGTARGQYRARIRAAVLAGSLAVVCPLAGIGPGLAQDRGPSGDLPTGTRTGKSGLPLPRFASLKSDQVHMRKGPGLQYPIVWVYRRAGLPVEVVNEFENWREVRDSDGASGWVFRPLLSNRRTALLIPWKIEPGKPLPQIELKLRPSANSSSVVTVEAGVIANIRSCNGRWCYLSIGSFLGNVEQERLWGVYKQEKIQ